MPNALISGITGFVGSHLAEYLLANTDWNIYGLMRWDDPLDNLVNIKNKVTLLEGDLTDISSLSSVIKQSKPDYIFHLAAQSYVQASFVYPSKTLHTNVIGTTNFLEVIKNLAPDALVHNCSSSEVYGKVDKDYGLIDEECPFAPASPYSISKISQDMLGRYYFEAFGLKILTTRMFTHTGPRRGDVFAESTFAKQVAMVEAGLIDTIKVGNLDSIRTIADVRDAVRAYHMLLTVNPVAGEAYNIGGDYTCTVKDILNTLNKDDYPIEEDQSRLRPLDANYQIPDCEKFTSHTGWKPEIPFEKTMDDLLEYWRDRIKHSVVLQR